MKFNQHLKVLRIMRNLNQKKMAKKLGISGGHLSMLENGKLKMSHEYFIRIVECLKLEIKSIQELEKTIINIEPSEREIIRRYFRIKGGKK